MNEHSNVNFEDWMDEFKKRNKHYTEQSDYSVSSKSKKEKEQCAPIIKQHVIEKDNVDNINKRNGNNL